MEHFLLVLHIFIAAALIGLVLIQRSESDGFGLGSGSGSNFMSGRSTANLLTRATAIMATLFILNSLVLSVLAARGRPPSIVETIQQQEKAAEKTDASGAPTVPLAGEDKKQPEVPAAAKDKKSSAPSVPAVGEEKMPAELPAASEPVVKKPVKKPVAEPDAQTQATDGSDEEQN
jgi:preprotein translocase subunit SecG